MLIHKTIDVSINIHNYVSVYSDPNAMIMQMLKMRYVGKIYSSCYIVEITRIVLGECIIKQDGSPDYGTVPVRMEVCGIIYRRGEIIPNCRIVRTDQSIIVATAEGVNVVMIQRDEYKSLRAGQIISVRVNISHMPLFGSEINVTATLMCPSSKFTVYRLNPRVVEYSEGIERQITLVETRLHEISELSPAARALREKISDYFYPYKTPQAKPEYAMEASLTGTVRQVLNSERLPAYIGRDSRIKPDWDKVYLFEAPPPDATVESNLPIEEVLTTLLADYTDYLSAITKMTGAYSSPSIIGEHKNLWALYTRMKV